MKLSLRIRHKPARMTLCRRGRMKIPMNTRTNFQEPRTKKEVISIKSYLPALTHTVKKQAGKISSNLGFGVWDLGLSESIFR